MPPAPRSRRVGARVVDLAVMLWVVIIVVVEVEGRLGGGDPWATRAVQPVTSAQVVVAFVGVVVVLDLLPTAIWGRSIGKALLGLQVVAAGPRRDGVPGPASRPDRVGLARAVLRSSGLFGWLAVPYAGVALMAVTGLTGLALPGGRGLHDRLAGTVVVAAPVAPGASSRRHRYPRRAVDRLPVPDVARAALTEVGVPWSVPGAFTVDLRITVFDETMFSIGEDPTGLALCVLSPGGEVVAVDPDGVRPPLLAGTSLPRFLDALDVLSAGGEGDALRAAVHAADAAAVSDPDSWWPTVLPAR